MNNNYVLMKAYVLLFYYCVGFRLIRKMRLSESKLILLNALQA